MGHDQEALDGNPDYYPEYCKLTGDYATEADESWKKKHPKWNAKAAYAADERARDRWYMRHSQVTAQVNNSPLPAGKNNAAQASADEILRCLNVFPSDNPQKGEYMVRYRMSDPTCAETGHGRYAVGYGSDPSEAAFDYAKNHIPSPW